jgi:hypothetical protein
VSLFSVVLLSPSYVLCTDVLQDRRRMYVTDHFTNVSLELYSPPSTSTRFHSLAARSTVLFGLFPASLRGALYFSFDFL